MTRFQAAAILATSAGILFACTEPPTQVVGAASDGLVFVRIVRGSNDLARARIPDGAVVAHNRTREREERWPYWSDRAEALVFQVSTDGSGADSDLWVWRPDGVGERALFETPHRDERWPAWSPTHRTLAYAFVGGRPRAGIALHAIQADQSVVVAWTGRRRFFFRPSFSPDGVSLVAQRRDATGTGSSIWVLDPGAEPRPLTSDPAWFDQKASFTRDGARIVLSRRKSAGGPREIAIVDRDGVGFRVIAPDPRADDHSARPSPKDDVIAFVSDRSGSEDVYLVDTDGSNLRNLTHTPERNEFAPRWSPDGQRIVVVAAPAGDGDVTLADREGLARSHVVVMSRDGEILLDVPGFMADWMPAWP